MYTTLLPYVLHLYSSRQLICLVWYNIIPNNLDLIFFFIHIKSNLIVKEHNLLILYLTPKYEDIIKNRWSRRMNESYERARSRVR